MSLPVAFEIGQAATQIKRIADLMSASQKDVFVRLPALMGYWPMGIRSLTGDVVEHSGTGTDLVEQGSCPVGFDGNSYVHLGDGANYLWSSPAGQIDGSETFVSSSINGLTLGGWFLIETIPTDTVGLISRAVAPPDFGYNLGLTVDMEPRFQASGNGSAVPFVEASAIPTDQWIFLAARFSPSTELAIFVNSNKDVETVAIPAALNVSAQRFEIGRYAADDDRVVHGKVRDVFLCAAALSDETIEEVRQTSI